MPRNNTREHQCYETPPLATFYSDYRIGNYDNQWGQTRLILQNLYEGRDFLKKTVVYFLFVVKSCVT